MTDLVPVQRPDNHLHRLLATFIEGKAAGSPHTADAYHRGPRSEGVPLPTKWHTAPGVIR